ncbi:hypothetical protein [Microbispora sp. NPDC049633]|uniref:hypothetical protein n=1 Tax=Microbispora sp. NPDC049633 TaxID=3154355 RepID=UPI00342BCF35
MLSRFDDGRAFIDEVLVPLSDAYEVVRRADYKAATGADEVDRLLRWLNLLDNDDRIPPAILYLSRPTVHTHDLHRFLADLERLAASLLSRRMDVTRRSSDTAEFCTPSRQEPTFSDRPPRCNSTTPRAGRL